MWSEREKERNMRGGCERVRRGLRKRESERDMEGEGPNDSGPIDYRR